MLQEQGQPETVIQWGEAELGKPLKHPFLWSLIYASGTATIHSEIGHT